MPQRKTMKTKSANNKTVRYAVVGLGHIAQVAVLPAFAHAKENSTLTALISSAPSKLKKLGRKYSVKNLFSYDEYTQALQSGLFDAVYIALPNNMHAEYTIRAAQERIHVLCEKPMAISGDECEKMIDAARKNDVRLMIAYRLHFEEANLEAVRIVQSGKLGDPRLFASTFTMNVKAGNIRTQAGKGGGPLNDIGIYCLNAARYIFQDEPVEVVAASASINDPRFADVPETVSATLRFPGERVATFICSFNGGNVSSYRVVGTNGDLLVEPAFEYAGELKHRLTIKGKSKERKFPKRDQFAPELVHFSQCVLTGKDPSPSGEEGMADVKIMEAIRTSARSGRALALEPLAPPQRPSLKQEMRKQPVNKPQVIKASAPTKE